MTILKNTATLHYDEMHQRSTFVDARNHLFLCVDGLRKYWAIPSSAKKLEVTLSTEEPTNNRQAHKIAFPGTGTEPPWCIAICPYDDEDWYEQKNDTYLAFDRFTTKFVQQSQQRSGWMQVHILEN